MTTIERILSLQLSERLSRRDALSLVDLTDVAPLLSVAASRRDEAHGDVVSYSRKVFIPLTQLCRDVCTYCTFAHAPKKSARAYLTPEDVLNLARRGRDAGCREALFTLGDKPELRYATASDELRNLGHTSTISYVAEMAELVLRETSLLPHINPGAMSAEELIALRRVSVSQGIMLESASERLCETGGPHFGSPDKHPSVRLATIRDAGQQGIPFTSGILIGIGETREERIDALLALRDLNDRYGHIQEIIIQNFLPKPGTRMAHAPAPSLIEHLWTIAMARLLFEPEMNIQAPPNLRAGDLEALVSAGINDWGGISPVTPDHVNPEAPWPHLDALARETQKAGKVLVERLAIYPGFARDIDRWVDSTLRGAVLDQLDGDGWSRTDTWYVGNADTPPAPILALLGSEKAGLTSNALSEVISKAKCAEAFTERDIIAMFRARGEKFTEVVSAADVLRRETHGASVSYVVTRNINYTNICSYKCQFCAFSKGKTHAHLRGRAYDLDPSEIADRAEEAWERGATEVCMQGGIHPSYTGARYLDILRAVKNRVPGLHIHAFSPLEVAHGARTLGVSIESFLCSLRDAGLGSLPGTAAEILDDEVREFLCPDKLTTAEWLDILRTAHGLGLKSTATIMFGHIERYEHWARHLLRIRDLQIETGGFTEFVPLPFVHMEAPIYLKKRARKGPTFREAILMHAISRIVLHPHIPNIQASWVKLGPEGVSACLDAGVNDLGGTLMDESISRAAGASHGQGMTPRKLEEIARTKGRIPWRRTTLYHEVETACHAQNGAFAQRSALVSAEQ